MKEILFDIIQILIIIIILTFYLLTHPSTNSECDINSNVVYSLNSYIIFSISTFFCVSISKLFLWYYFKNKIVLHVIQLTLSYGLILFVAVGGIFIAQQMNEKHTCYNFFIDNKNIFSIFISILFLVLLNIIYKCIECKNEQINEQSSRNYDEYRRLINSI
jgi:hypothetical protein